MPASATLIFPNQLFDPHPALEKGTPVHLIEDGLFFGTDQHQPLRFHQQKLMLHRACMKAYATRLVKQGYAVTYIECGTSLDDALPREADELRLADPVDYLLERRLRRYARRTGQKLRIFDTPMFLTAPNWFNPWFDGRKRYYMADFYAAQRKRLNILVDRAGKPVGGKWSFDADNRKRWPKNLEPPPVYAPAETPHLAEARAYVAQRFAENPGSTQNFMYPITHEQALDALRHFLTHRFRGFGDYEDAISTRHAFLHHALLTPALNTGLLTPRQVLDETLAAMNEFDIPLNDAEGFIRQIIGWREFMRIVYVREGVKQRTTNFWNHRRKLNARWYTGATGLDPVDHAIRRVLDRAYSHHIERLMVLGNAMLLCELDPDEIYRWFMELYIDAYDWVMVPNVYGMSQYADGGLITTKPYFSGSNYLKKMSDHPAGDWCDIWDGLFWRFIDRHRDFYERQSRLSMMVRTLDKMDPAKKSALLDRAREFLVEASTGA
jgi:deoxyribodipyrimidine photolyase-related protein